MRMEQRQQKSITIIKTPDNKDYSELEKFGLKFLRNNNIKQYDKTLFRRYFARCVSHGFARIVVHEGKIVGGMFALILPNNWGKKMALDLWCYSEMYTPQLLKEYKKWAGDTPAVVTNTFGNERFDRLIELMGFKKTSTVFVSGE